MIYRLILTIWYIRYMNLMNQWKNILYVIHFHRKNGICLFFEINGTSLTLFLNWNLWVIGSECIYYGKWYNLLFFYGQFIEGTQNILRINKKLHSKYLTPISNITKRKYKTVLPFGIEANNYFPRYTAKI